MSGSVFVSRMALLAGVATLPLASACGALENDRTPAAQQSQAPLCAIAPGEDVCARSFDGLIAPEDRTAVVGFVARAAELSGLAQERHDEIVRACQAIVDGLGATAPTPLPGDDDDARATALCDAAVLAIGKVNRSAFSLRASSGTCVDVPSPSCAADRAALSVDCSAGTVTLTENDGATARDAADAAILQKNLAIAIGVKGWGEAFARLSASIAKSAGALPVRDPGSVHCQLTATSLTVRGTEQAKRYIELALAVVQAIDPEL